MTEKEIGKVTHYFPKVGVAIVKLTDSLALGDVIHFKGETIDFEQGVESMQVEHKAIEKAEAGEEVGVKVSGKVKEGNKVYKVIAE